MQTEWETDLAGLYIQIEAKKRRIKIITVEIVAKRRPYGWRGPSLSDVPKGLLPAKFIPEAEPDVPRSIP
jgi:hypothetical protein